MAIIIDGVKVAGLNNNVQNFMKVYEAVISASNWTYYAELGIKEQIVPVANIISSNTARVDHANSSIDGTLNGYTRYVDEENEYLKYITNGYAETVNGGIKFVIFDEQNTIDIPIVIEVI